MASLNKTLLGRKIHCKKARVQIVWSPLFIARLNESELKNSRSDNDFFSLSLSGFNYKKCPGYCVRVFPLWHTELKLRVNIWTLAGRQQQTLFK
jgi:hypothetical protein